MDILRKVVWDFELSGVEVLPRVLRIHHDTLDPTTGLSPYQILFGRDRILGGLPWSVARECEEATDFLSAMKKSFGCGSGNSGSPPKIAENVKLRLVFILGAALLSILVIGYHFGTIDQSVHIPFLKIEILRISPKLIYKVYIGRHSNIFLFHQESKQHL